LVAITLVATWAQYGSLFKMLQISTTAAVSVIWFLGFVALSETTNRYTGWSKSLCAPDDYNTESYK
jgi:hypothetical protein